MTLFHEEDKNLMIKNKLMGAKMGHFKDFSLFYRPWLGSLACLGSGGTRVRSSWEEERTNLSTFRSL